MARNIHRFGEALGGAIQKPAMKILPGGKRDRMNKDVQLTPNRSLIRSNMASN